MLPAALGRDGYIDVRSFGAKGDGMADDTRSIQKALDYSRDNGGIVYFPDGTYMLGTLLFDEDKSGIAAALHVYSGQTLIFEKGAVLKRANAKVTHMVFTHNDENALGYTGCSDVTIIGATFDENSSLGTNDTALNISHSDRVRVIGCEFFGASGSWHSIEINSSRNVSVEKCLFHDNSNSEDIQIDAAIGAGNLGVSDGTVCHDITITGCTFISDGHASIGNHSDAAHHDILIKGNTFRGTTNPRSFIAFVPLTHNITLTDNHFQ